MSKKIIIELTVNDEEAVMQHFNDCCDLDDVADVICTETQYEYMGILGDAITVTETTLKDSDKPEILYASTAHFSGDDSINTILFKTREDAVADCKAQFERSLAEGKVNGDLDEDMPNRWSDDEDCGIVYWIDGDNSTFEVKDLTVKEQASQEKEEEEDLER